MNLVSHIKRRAGIEALENRELGRIVGPKRNEVIVGLRKLQHEEVHNLYYLINVIYDEIKEN